MSICLYAVLRSAFLIISVFEVIGCVRMTCYVSALRSVLVFSSSAVQVMGRGEVFRDVVLAVVRVASVFESAVAFAVP